MPAPATPWLGAALGGHKCPGTVALPSRRGSGSQWPEGVERESISEGVGVSMEMSEGSSGTWGSHDSICYSCLLLKTVKIQKSIEKWGILQE